MITLANIQAALERHDPIPLPPPEKMHHRAAVALILAGLPEDLRLCFILRAERAGDRWSGQMAFPGGRASEEDSTPRDIAVRETSEEVGVRLEDEHHLGDLSDLSIRRKGLDVDGIITPLVFYLGKVLPPLTLNEEVASAHWIALGHLWSPENASAIDLTIEGEVVAHPGIRFDEQIIWGLSHRILTSFSELIAQPLPSMKDRDSKR
ncbi:MAG: CoA pyrophosphatase [Planctomycetota bacterium]|nr:CoA pyrophosphatase [Planctomycetota bacterium]